MLTFRRSKSQWTRYSLLPSNSNAGANLASELQWSQHFVCLSSKVNLLCLFLYLLMLYFLNKIINNLRMRSLHLWCYLTLYAFLKHLHYSASDGIMRTRMYCIHVMYTFGVIITRTFSRIYIRSRTEWYYFKKQYFSNYILWFSWIFEVSQWMTAKFNSPLQFLQYTASRCSVKSLFSTSCILDPGQVSDGRG